MESEATVLPPIGEAGEAAVIRAGLGKTEGPVWLGDGTVVCTSIDHGRLYLVDSAGLTALECPGGPNGIAVGRRGAYVARNGGLWGATPSDPAIVLVSAAGHTDLVPLPADSSPNDLAFAPDGRLWFTDTGHDANPYDPSVRAGRVWSCTPDGTDLRVELSERPFPNGLAFSPDGAWLYVTETAARRVLRMPWSQRDLGQPQVLAELPAGMPDGFAVDELGRLWLAATSADCLFLLSPDGAWLGTLPTGPGSRPTNCCFGGPDGTDIFVAASGTGALLRVHTRVHGASLRADGPVSEAAAALRAAARATAPPAR